MQMVAQENSTNSKNSPLIPIEKTVNHLGNNIAVKLYKNKNKPTIILLHGFPDNSHLYDLLIPELIYDFEIVVFDFIGWGNSDKPEAYNYFSISQKEELNSVINALQIEKVILLAHDASGPPAINWAIENENKINKLVLLNTYYSNMPTLKAPEAIWLFSTPIIRGIARPLARIGKSCIFHKMYYWQVGKFFSNMETKNNFLPILNEQFKNKKTQNAFFKLNKDLRATLKKNTQNISKLKSFNKPVQIIFGAEDKYLNIGVAKEFKKTFPNSDLHIVKNAKHFIQMDKPKEIKNIIVKF